MRRVHIHIDSIVVETGSFDRAQFEATLKSLAENHSGDYPSGTAPVLTGAPETDLARSVWHSIVPGGERR